MLFRSLFPASWSLLYGGYWCSGNMVRIYPKCILRYLMRIHSRTFGTWRQAWRTYSFWLSYFSLLKESAERMTNCVSQRILLQGRFYIIVNIYQNIMPCTSLYILSLSESMVMSVFRVINAGFLHCFQCW